MSTLPALVKRAGGVCMRVRVRQRLQESRGRQSCGDKTRYSGILLAPLITTHPRRFPFALPQLATLFSFCSRYLLAYPAVRFSLCECFVSVVFCKIRRKLCTSRKGAANSRLRTLDLLFSQPCAFFFVSGAPRMAITTLRGQARTLQSRKTEGTETRNAAGLACPL